jgi:hypothetical protein
MDLSTVLTIVISIILLIIYWIGSQLSKLIANESKTLPAELTDVRSFINSIKIGTGVVASLILLLLVGFVGANIYSGNLVLLRANAPQLGFLFLLIIILVIILWVITGTVDSFLDDKAIDDETREDKIQNSAANLQLVFVVGIIIMIIFIQYRFYSVSRSTSRV